MGRCPNDPDQAGGVDEGPGYRKAMNDRLRPIERRILELHRQGVDHGEIGARFRKSPEFVGRVLAWIEIPREPRGPRMEGHRAVERRVLDLRSQGLSHEEIGKRFARDARYSRRIEELARLRTDLGLA